MPALVQALVCSFFLGACGAAQTAAPSAVAPFLTSTLPPSLTPQPTQTPLPPTPVPTLPPIEGSTTTQLNVRADPSTGAASVGMLDPFSRVQVIAKDAGENWYQILYSAAPDGKGWVRSQYVQVPDPAEIPPLSGAPGAQSGPSGIVTQQVNVRSGPGTSFDALGTLNPQDSVTLTGKNADGTWLQIAFTSGPGGRGWIAAGYIQSNETTALPILGEQGQVVGTGTPEAVAPLPTPTVLAAFQDSDSAANPSTDLTFSPSGAGSLQFTSDVSAPEGDPEDWIQFTPYLSDVSIQLGCQGSAEATAELWQHGAALADLPALACGEVKIYSLMPRQAYQARVLASSAPQGLESTRYTLIISTLR